MNEKEIVQLIESNTTDKTNLFLSTILDKAKSIDKQLNLTSLGMLILILIYYLGELKLESGLEIGPLKFSDLKSLLYVLPLVLSFLILRFVILSSHKAEIKNIIKYFALHYFSYDNSKIDIVHTDDFTRMMLPMSIHDEIGKFNLKTKTGCLSVILILPNLVFAVAPYLFVIAWSYPHIINFKLIGFYNKVLVISTAWVLIMSLFYLYKTMRLAIKENKD